jgi:hypothetical protein
MDVLDQKTMDFYSSGYVLELGDKGTYNATIQKNVNGKQQVKRLPRVTLAKFRKEYKDFVSKTKTKTKQIKKQPPLKSRRKVKKLV